MRAKSKLTFDELDRTLLKELPLLSDVLSSTANKIARLFSPIYHDILEVCNSNIPKGWEIDRKTVENQIYPFSSEQGRSKVTSLENFFQIENSITFIMKDGKKWINFLEIQFGLYFDAEYEEYNEPYFYFMLYREPSPKFQGKLFPFTFYEEIRSKYPDIRFHITHPEMGDKTEQMEILIEIENIDTLETVSTTFSQEILPRILNGINHAV